jgi:hypothetical protein
MTDFDKFEIIDSIAGAVLAASIVGLCLLVLYALI